MILNRFELATTEQKQYPVDYSRWLQTGQTILSVVPTVTPATVPALTVSAVVDASGTSLTVAAGTGGVDETEYTVEILATMQNPTEIKRDFLVFTVKDAVE